MLLYLSSVLLSTTLIHKLCHLAMEPNPLDHLTVDEIYELTDVLNSAGITRSSSEESLESMSTLGDITMKMRYYRSPS